ncbi:BrnA antitoxin family protein [Mycoplana sp. MJR14]|uniref:BrnA antitoxin family protein n=1 Tax=Mycoplana sp. MJR14 TaxID=3032583 RepID=UPI000DD8528A|nr:BrnA antitoxin family protein [Mycoplana sp. MJR14]MDF1631732.1 BrnA antitoxin family protein [Mycoplana sp. MJR14]
MASKHRIQNDFQPGRGYSKEDWDAVSDNPPLTEAEMKQARPFKEAFPEIAEKMEKAVRGRPKAEQTKTPVTIRLDPDIVDHYKATGKGWQSRMNDDLRKAAGL